jgi:hypothetical protein
MGERCIQDFGGEAWGKETILETQKYMEGNIKMDLQIEG